MAILGGLFLVFGAAYMISSQFGTQVSIDNNQVREYHSRFFLKTGKWYDLKLFPDITILKISRSMTVTDRLGASHATFDTSKNEVYLLSANHRKKILLKICNSYADAEKNANELAKLLDKKIVQFNPKISKSTKDRKRR